MQALEHKKEFGAAVKSERVRQGLSQETLAERADLHRTYITDIERGARNLSLETIYKIAAALGVSICSLFDRAEKRSSMNPHSNWNASIVEVLLVEDDQHDVELTLEAFRQAGMTNQIHIVRDGATALDFVFCRRQFAQRRIETNPQVILLDLNLPKVGGMEVLRQIKNDERTRNLHVIVLTTSRADEHVGTAMQSGAAACIVKPVGFENFSKVTPKLNLQWALLAASA